MKIDLEISKTAILEAVQQVVKSFDFEFGPVVDYAGYQTDCEFAGCERQATYFIQSPNYHRYNNIYGYACEIHATVQTLVLAAKYTDKWLDEQYCKVCESSAYACECPSKDALNGDSSEQRKEGENISYNTCRICLCDMSEHNWEAHAAEMKADAEY